MAVTLGSKNVGDIVKLRENGTLIDFIILHKGLPSGEYDTSCNGVWIMRTAPATKMAMNPFGSSSDYENSNARAWLENTYYNLFDAVTKGIIKQVKIPYKKGGGAESGDVKRGASGLLSRCFLLSASEACSNSASIEREAYIFGTYILGTLVEYMSTSVTINNILLGFFRNHAGLRTPSSNMQRYFAYPYGTEKPYFAGTGSEMEIWPVMIMDNNAFVNSDGTMTANTAPTTPGSISVPVSVQGGSTITVSWGASTDAQGNLEGYKLERSINNGGWSQIYQGGGTSTTNNVAYGTNTVTYRVKAYDSIGLESGYRTSNNVTVINNTAPGAPQSITVPADVRGGNTLTISWGPSVDAENNLAGYELERSVNGGTWERIYKNAQQSFTDSITLGWNTVAYRVRAYDAYNAYSSYTASQARTVNNNRPPQIICDFAAESDLGVKNEGFSIIYTVADPDNSTGDVIVTESLDGMRKKEFNPELEAENIFSVEGMDFQCLLNGQHSITISASDGKESCIHTLTFTKSVTSAMVTLKTPVNTEDRIKVCAVEVNGYIPEDAKYHVLVTNNAKDTEPAWEDCTQAVKNGANYLFTNQNAENGYAFNFRISVSRGESGTGGYITAVQGGFQ